MKKENYYRIAREVGNLTIKKYLEDENARVADFEKLIIEYIFSLQNKYTIDDIPDIAYQIYQGITKYADMDEDNFIQIKTFSTLLAATYFINSFNLSKHEEILSITIKTE